MAITALVALLVVGLCRGQSTVNLLSGGRSFSSAAKGAEVLAFIETTLFEMEDGPGYVTQQWFTGSALQPHSRVRIYIDGEESASMDFDLYMFHGIGNCDVQESQTPPWGTRRIGNMADNGGLYNTMRIPFSKSIKVTVTSTQSGAYWYIIHGVIGLPLIINGFELPAGTRLRLYNIDNKLLLPFEFVTGASVQGKAGWLYMVTLSANSSNFVYLEACFRLYVDGRKVQFLSSGTEDFFLSAFYFDTKNSTRYHTDAAGLTCFEEPGTMSAYKFFEEDPVIFNNSMTFMWRCSEKQGDLNGCPNVYQPDELGDFDAKNTTISLYTWVYEFSPTQS